jgi:very-short-patch-repair endonuclease
VVQRETTPSAPMGREIEDSSIADLATRQKGVVGHAQLTALGFSRKAIVHRVRTGRLHPLHRGVYAVGHRVTTREGRWMAAILACGDGTVLSHRSAAELWAIRKIKGARVEVTTRAWRPRVDGILRHTSSSMPFDEITEHEGIPVTTVPRTLLDLAAVLKPREVERAINEAEVLRLGDALSLPELIARHSGRRGTKALRDILGDLDAQVTREELEKLFKEFVRAHHLPRPSLNVVVGPYELDAVWWKQKVAVELDGFATHGPRQRFESDRERDRKLQVMGWRVVRITWRQLAADAQGVVDDLRALGVR